MEDINDNTMTSHVYPEISSTVNDEVISRYRLRYRTAANNSGLIELAELRHAHQHMIDDIRRTFDLRRRQRQPDDVDIGNTSERLIDTYLPTADDDLLPSDSFQLPVCVKGQMATYPSPLHAVLAQYSDCKLSVQRMSPLDESRDSDVITGDSQELSRAEELHDKLRVALLDMRLSELRRTGSSSSALSSEGYHSGTETDSDVDKLTADELTPRTSVSSSSSSCGGHRIKKGRRLSRPNRFLNQHQSATVIDDEVFKMNIFNRISVS